MARTVTVTFDDGSQHAYQGVPDDATPDQVTARAQKDFAGRTITGLDGGRQAAPASGQNPQDPFNPAVIGRGLLGAGEVAGAGLVNGVAAIPNAAIDLASRATGFGPRKPIPQVPVGQAGQETLEGLRKAASALEGTPTTDEQIRQQIIAERNKQIDGTFAGDLVRNTGEVGGDVATLYGAASAAAARVANGTATAAEIRAMRPDWARAGFSSEQAAAGHELGLRNGLDNPVAGYLSGSAKRELLTNGNADVGNAVARYAARVPQEVAPGVATPLSKEALDEALAPMEAVYQRAASGIPNGNAVLLKLRQLRHDGFAAMNSDDPKVIASGRDLLRQADGIESFIEKNISPTSGTSLEQLRSARQAIAQNRAVYDALQGEDINLPALGRMYRNGPTNYFADGPLKTLARFAEDNGAVVGKRIKGADTTLRQGVEGASGALDITKPGSWPQVARVTGVIPGVKSVSPQAFVRGPGVSQTLKTLAPRDPNEFAPLPPGQ